MKMLALSLLLAPVMLAAWPVKVLLVTGSSDEPHHHWRETSATLREILEQSGRFTVSTMDEPRGLNVVALEGYDVVLLDYNGPRLPAAAETALESYVRNGGGFGSFANPIFGIFNRLVGSARGVPER